MLRGRNLGKNSHQKTRRAVKEVPKSTDANERHAWRRQIQKLLKNERLLKLRLNILRGGLGISIGGIIYDSSVAEAGEIIEGRIRELEKDVEREIKEIEDRLYRREESEESEPKGESRHPSKSDRHRCRVRCFHIGEEDGICKYGNCYLLEGSAAICDNMGPFFGETVDACGGSCKKEREFSYARE